MSTLQCEGRRRMCRDHRINISLCWDPALEVVFLFAEYNINSKVLDIFCYFFLKFFISSSACSQSHWMLSEDVAKEGRTVSIVEELIFKCSCWNKTLGAWRLEDPLKMTLNRKKTLYFVGIWSYISRHDVHTRYSWAMSISLYQ